MEFEQGIIRIEVCQKCYEHEKTVYHSEFDFHQAFLSCKKQLQTHGFQILRNIPFKYLLKTRDSKVSTRRYVDQNTNRLSEFPRIGAFQVYYLNILVFSRLQQGQFPNEKLLSLIILQLKKYYQNNPLLSGFDSFRNLQMQWKKSQKLLDSFYSHIQLYCSESSDKADIQEVIKNLSQSKPQKTKRKQIYPYSFYAQREKKSELERIYCCGKNRSLNCSRYQNVSPKVSSFFTNGRPVSGSLSQKTKFKRDLFSMVRGDEINFDEKKKYQLKNEDLFEVSKKKKKNSKKFYIPHYSKPVKRSSNVFLKGVGDGWEKLTTSRQTQKKQGQIEKGKSSQRSNQLTEKDNSSQLQKKQKSENFSKSSDSLHPLQSRDQLPPQQIKELVKKQIQFIIQEANHYQFLNSKELQENQDSHSQAQKQSHEEEIIEKKGGGEEEWTLEQWEIQQFSFDCEYEPANILKKFSELINFNSSLFQKQWKKRNSNQIHFNIDGRELYQSYNLMSLRKVFKPKEIRLFPELFIEVQNSLPHKLPYVVNLLMKQSPHLITRLYQNKKFINPFGNYCIWLKGKKGFQPIIINDQFAFDECSEPIYAKLTNENSIWFMLLEKAFAKVLGGYTFLAQCSIGDFLSMILGCPKVQFKNLSPQKLGKILSDKIFYNRLAYLYVLPDEKQFSASSSSKQIERITNYNREKNKDPTLILHKGRRQKTCLQIAQFLTSYNAIHLLFFSSHFFINQKGIPCSENSKLITLTLTSKTFKNQCYLLFKNFPQLFTTKVLIYKKLTEDIPIILDDMIQLQEETKYEYLGQIQKKENFFFETELQVGEYLCILQSKFEENSDMSLYIYSDKDILISDLVIHPISKPKKQMESTFHSYEKKNSSHSAQTKKRKKTSRQVTFQHQNTIEEENIFGTQNKIPTRPTVISVPKGKMKKKSEFRVKKQFIFDDDCSTQNNN